MGNNNNDTKIKILIVSSEKRSAEIIRSGFDSLTNNTTEISHTAKDEKKKLSENNFDIIIINAPLSDEFGENLAASACRKHDASILIMVKKELYNDAIKIADDNGYFCISKPVSKEFLTQTVKILLTAGKKLKKMEKQKEKLETEVDDIKRIRRAQYLLMEKLGMSENEAYKYIEKQSMDLCERKSDVAKRIIMTYEI